MLPEEVTQRSWALFSGQLEKEGVDMEEQWKNALQVCTYDCTLYPQRIDRVPEYVQMRNRFIKSLKQRYLEGERSMELLFSMHYLVNW